jgi:hypothetical protein
MIVPLQSHSRREWHKIPHIGSFCRFIPYNGKAD